MTPTDRRNLLRSLAGAWRGLVAAYLKEPNLRFHVAAAWLALGLGWLADFDALRWTCLVTLIGVVVFAELVNTAMERLGDVEAGGEPSFLVGEAKQVAAAAVLVAALAALTGGLILFGPRREVMLGRLPAIGQYPAASVLYLAVLLALVAMAVEARCRPLRRGEP